MVSHDEADIEDGNEHKATGEACEALQPPGMPPHIVRMKIGCVLMVLTFKYFFFVMDLACA